MVDNMTVRDCNANVTIASHSRNIIMAFPKTPELADAVCPDCGSDALYKYGKSKAGKQRYLCLMCKRQFTHGAQRTPMKGKPLCPECGGMMHLYKREAKHIRFRCSAYPECRTFVKVAIATQEEKCSELLPS